MLHIPQLISIRDNGVSLATLADSTILPVLLERGEQPFFDWFYSVDLTMSEGQMFKESELQSLGGTKLYASGQCPYLDGYHFITAAFDKLWSKAVEETEMLRASHFRMEASLHQWHGHFGHDYGFELEARLQGYVLKNSLS